MNFRAAFLKLLTIILCLKLLYMKIFKSKKRLEICVAKKENKPLSMISYFETKIGEIFEKIAKRLKKWNFKKSWT